MDQLRQVTARGVRQQEGLLVGQWIAKEIVGGYTVQCGEVQLHTVNAQKLRVFRSLDAVKKALKRELGVTEFKVEVMKQTA